ncbi:MAG: putative F0F1-ATPase subunit (ATPase) [Actinomycetia bacterium]|nr:putative F0F1-ATPase subunit (ATPase) [Actinomycetes bacterium]
MNLRDRQATYNGFGNALSQAVEIVATPLLFALVGFFLDRLAGTRPLFTVSLALFALVGMALRMYYAYREAMAREEEGKPWTRSRQ